MHPKASSDEINSDLDADRPRELAARSSSGYPEPFARQVLPREKRALGDAAGLTKIGVNLTTLWPGAASSMRHWHTHEDELIYLLEGELVLVTDSGERPLRAGQCAGFPAGHRDGHQLVNRSTSPRSISRSAIATPRTPRSIRTWTWSGMRPVLPGAYSPQGGGDRLNAARPGSAVPVEPGRPGDGQDQSVTARGLWFDPPAREYPDQRHHDDPIRRAKKNGFLKIRLRQRRCGRRFIRSPWLRAPPVPSLAAQQLLVPRPGWRARSRQRPAFRTTAGSGRWQRVQARLAS